ncbi:MAG: glycosyltransferase [Candidatus Cloacimonadota bacterium]|nr:glycosyltransferase [Candidatus Cloacimonadota bacterium]
MKIINILFVLVFIYYCYYLRIFFKGLERKYLKAVNEQPFVSVIVAARNEERNIPNLLTTLLNQDYPQESYEIIIANDQSIDRTAEIVKDFQKKFENLKLIDVKISDKVISRKKNALSQGIAKSKGEIILTTDADCIVKTTWISGMVRYFDKNIGMVAGLSTPNILNWRLANFVEKYEYLDTIALFSAGAGCIGKDKPFSCSGQNLAYTREAYSSVGGFEKIKKHISGDDILLMQLIRKAGYKIRFAFGEETYTLTKSEKSLGGFLNQRIRWASNEKAQTAMNQEFFLFLVDVFLLNLIIIITIFFSPLIFIIMLIIKSLVDFIVTNKGINRFKLDKRISKFFPFWALIQPFYIVVAGIGSRLGLFRWKK